MMRWNLSDLCSAIFSGSKLQIMLQFNDLTV
jgi:hypothetical protein